MRFFAIVPAVALVFAGLTTACSPRDSSGNAGGTSSGGAAGTSSGGTAGGTGSTAPSSMSGASTPSK